MNISAKTLIIVYFVSILKRQKSKEKNAQKGAKRTMLKIKEDKMQELNYKNKIADLEQQLAELKQQLAEKDKEIERLKKEIKEPEEIWNAHLAELKEKVKQKLAQEFTEKINEMLKEKVEEKTIDLNNQIRMLKKNQYTKVEQMQNIINGYLKIIRAYNSNKNQKAIEQLEKVKENAWQSATDISCLLDYTELAKIIDNQIKELKGENK